MLHSAHWDDSVQLEGKRVAVIGSGSSAVQIIPTIQPSKFRRYLPGRVF
jgi:cation diffusion facilitator CzcD-associated flavoprotein CzcO